MYQIACYPEITFGQGMEVTCIWLNSDWFSSLLLFTPTRMCSIFDVSRQRTDMSARAIGPIRFPLILPQGRGSCTCKALHLLKWTICRNAGSLCGVSGSHKSTVLREESKEMWLRPILNKSHHCRWAEFTPPKVPLFGYIFQLEESDGVFALAFWLGHVNSQGWGKC